MIYSHNLCLWSKGEDVYHFICECNHAIGLLFDNIKYYQKGKGKYKVVLYIYV